MLDIYRSFKTLTETHDLHIRLALSISCGF